MVYEGTSSQQGVQEAPIESARIVLPGGEQASSTFDASDHRSFPGASPEGLRHPLLDLASSLQALAATSRANDSGRQGVSPFATLGGGGDNALFLNPMFSNSNPQSNTRSNELSDTMLRYQALIQLQLGRAAQQTPSVFGSMLATSSDSTSQQNTHDPASSDGGGGAPFQRQPQSLGLSFGTGGPSPYSEPGNRFIGEAINQLLMRQQIAAAGQRLPQEHPNPLLLGRQMGLLSAGLAQQSIPQSNQSPAWFGNSSSIRGNLLYGGRQQSSGLAAGAATGATDSLLISLQQTSAVLAPASGLSAFSEEDQQQVSTLGPDGFPLGLPMIIAHPEDKFSKLSAHQLLLRHQIEVFRASADDISTHTRGRNKPIMIGKIGIRCRHCAHIPVGKRQKGSTYFPATILGLYQAAQNMSTIHLQCGLCPEMPVGLKHQFVYLISTKVASSGAGGPFWARAAKKLGLVDTDDGIRFIRDLPPEKRPSRTIGGSSNEKMQG